MVETDFAIAVAKSIKKSFTDSFVWRPRDAYTLGIPDVLAYVSKRAPMAVEVKQLARLLRSPHDCGRRTTALLHHPFSGPQISILRSLERAGVEAYGMIRITSDAAVRVLPADIPADGNYMHEHLMKVGALITRTDGVWRFWTGG